MQTINKIRKTNQFNISGTEACMIAQIVPFLTSRREKLIAIANHADNACVYTVRVYDDNGIRDHLIACYGSPRIEETVVITGTYPVAA